MDTFTFFISDPAMPVMRQLISQTAKVRHMQMQAKNPPFESTQVRFLLHVSNSQGEIQTFHRCYLLCTLLIDTCDRM